MQYHHIQLVAEADLPHGHDWIIAEHDEQITLFIAERALTPGTLEQAWAGYRLLTQPRHPRPRLVHPRMAAACAPSPLSHTA